MAATVIGRLTNSKGDPLAEQDVELELVQLQNKQEFYLTAISSFTTDVDGNFIITPLYQGRYIIRYKQEIIKILVPSSNGTYVVSAILDEPKE